MSEHFGEILKEYRLKKDFSLRNLANLVNVSFSYINKLEKGKYSPSKEVVIDLANALGVPQNEFLSAAGYLPDNFHFTREEKILSIIRRTHPHIIELIEQASELPEEQQEMIAGHWKWALDVIRKQEEYKAKNEQSLNIKEEAKLNKYQDKETTENDDIDVRSTPMAANLKDKETESIPLTPELEDVIENGIRESRQKKQERKKQEKRIKNDSKEADTDNE